MVRLTKTRNPFVERAAVAFKTVNAVAMAELGDFVEQGPMSRGQVTLEMMDYKFVDECTARSSRACVHC